MKKFNEKFSDDNPTSTSVEKEFGDVAPYKASESNNNNNINTAQPNNDNHPQMSVNSLLEKDNRTYYTDDNSTNPNSNYNSNVNYTYVPTYKSTQNKKNTIKITSDIKTLLVLVFILFIFILVIPSIYDFIREIKMG